MACGKKIFYECVACVCLTFGTIFLVIAFLMAIGFLVGVMTISFALQIDFTNLCGIQKMVSLQRVLLKRY